MRSRTSTELHFKTSKALDALANSADIVDSLDEPINLSNFLQLLSTLSSGAECFGKQNLTKKAAKLLEPIQSSIFNYRDEACVIANETSSTISNALLSYLYFKTNKAKATPLARSVIRSLHKDSVDFFYAPGTKEEELKKAHKEISLGYVSYPLMIAFEKTGHQKFLIQALSVIGIAIQNGRYDHLDVWSLKKAFQHVRHEQYAEKAERIISVLNGQNLDELPAINLAMILLTNLAWFDILTPSENKIQILIEKLLTMQNNDGLFYNDESEDKILTTIRVVNSFLSYMALVEHRHFQMTPIL